MMVTVDGYFEGPNHDISWHNVDAEFDVFANDQLGTMGTILFGKRTYDLMVGFWPTKPASSSKTGQLMNTLPKVVVSHEPFEATWANTTVISSDVLTEIKKLKEEKNSGGPGGAGDIGMFGSNALCVSLMEAGLVDEFRIMTNPVALGVGSPLFTGLTRRMALRRTTPPRSFASGNVLTIYEK